MAWWAYVWVFWGLLWEEEICWDVIIVLVVLIVVIEISIVDISVIAMALTFFLVDFCCSSIRMFIRLRFYRITNLLFFHPIYPIYYWSLYSIWLLYILFLQFCLNFLQRCSYCWFPYLMRIWWTFSDYLFIWILWLCLRFCSKTCSRWSSNVVWWGNTICWRISSRSIIFLGFFLFEIHLFFLNKISEFILVNIINIIISSIFRLFFSCRHNFLIFLLLLLTHQRMPNILTNPNQHSTPLTIPRPSLTSFNMFLKF